MEELLVIVYLVCKPVVRVDYTATSTYIQINNVEDSYQCEEVTRTVTDVPKPQRAAPTSIVRDDTYQEWRYEEVPKLEVSDSTDDIPWGTVSIIDGSEWANKPADQYTIHDEVSYEQLRQDDTRGDGGIQ